MKDTFDVIVIGAGPAGYHAAIRCTQQGLHTACIDRSTDNTGKPVLGGTCLNWGCIPSKALLDISHKYAEALVDYKSFGIELGKPKINIKQMMAFKEQVVGKLTGGVRTLMQAGKIEVLSGTGCLIEAGVVSFQPLKKGKPTRLQAKHIILAPGSQTITLSDLPLDESRIVDSTGALEFSTVPKKLGVIGAGVIGLELGSVWARLGSKVTILEALDDFLPQLDRRLASSALTAFKKSGLDIRLGARVKSSRLLSNQVKVKYSDEKGEHELGFDKLIVAVGRRPATENLVDKNCPLKIDDRGFIEVDDLCQTSIEGVYAVGDAVRGPMLAHKGMEEGLMVADRLAGKPSLVNYQAIPGVIYTAPEIAWVGDSEEAVKAAGIPCKTGSFSFAANGRALAGNVAEGMVKIIAHADTDRILGVHVFGPQASELIAQAVQALEFSASAEDIALTMCAHPSLSEVVHEAAMAANNEAIHAVNKQPAKQR